MSISHSFGVKILNRLLLLALTIFLGACTFSLVDLPGVTAPTPTPNLPYEIPPTPPPLPQAEITFRVAIPEDTPQGEDIYLTILDEVTGLALNAEPQMMQLEDTNHYRLTTLLTANSVVKYRYTRQGSLAAVEHGSNGRPIRYRLLRVDGPMVVEDIVSRWNDTLFSAPFGRIQGQVKDQATGQPIPNIIVTAGGLQTISSADGSYLLEGLPIGQHNLTAYARDGSYTVFQQGALVGENATTPAPIVLSSAPLVDVVFTVILPEDTIPGVPIRVAGNLSQLGNTFSDLEGGISTLGSQMPVLSPLPDGRQNLKLSLPAGTYIRYKYTLGDGFWNAEHLSDGSFHIRELIVPGENLFVEDVVTTWKSGNSAPIWFDVTVPPDTPAGDTISIQFNPYGWTQPLQMWRLEENRWAYLLSSPLDILGTIGYRYCRNEQCGFADDAMTPGDSSGGRPVSTSVLPQTLRDKINQWAWLETKAGPVTVPGGEIEDRGSNFIAGVEFQGDYHPSWTPYLPNAIRTVSGLGANWIILTPSWSVTRSDPPIIEAIPGEGLSWDNLTEINTLAKEQGLDIALRPITEFSIASDEWWASGGRDFPWWEDWFEQYRTFALHYADFGAQVDARMLILGGDWLQPALPGGTLADGTPSGTPADAEERWRALIAEVKTRYGGTIAWAISYQEKLQNPPAFLDAVDQIHLLWSAPLANRAGVTSMDLAAEAAEKLDTAVLPSLASFEKPVVLSIAYPSAKGGVTGCLRDRRGDCIPWQDLSAPTPDIPNTELSLDEQVEVYNAMLIVTSERDWVEGFISQGYYPPVVLRDKSTSVNGKPAADILSYWYPRLLGNLP